MESLWLAAVLIVSALALLFCMRKSGHFFKSLLYSVMQGGAALFAVNALAGFTGVSLAVNGVTLAVGALGGIPGVILMLCTKLMLSV